MELHGARALVVGATGVVGAEISRRLAGRGARLVLAGRDEQRLAAIVEELGAVESARFDADDLHRVTEIVDRAAVALDGLDLIVIASGVAGFGPAAEADLADLQRLLHVNTVAPIAAIRAALPHLARSGGTVAALSAILADYPTGEMAAYSASKAALSSWLTALRHEQRGHGITVFDIRPPHMDTGLVDRALGAAPPTLPGAVETTEVVDRIVAGLEAGHRELSYDIHRDELASR